MIPKRGVQTFTETGVVFGDGSEAHDLDLVVLCTGFESDYSVLDIPGFKGTTLGPEATLSAGVHSGARPGPSHRSIQERQAQGLILRPGQIQWGQVQWLIYWTLA